MECLVCARVLMRVPWRAGTIATQVTPVLGASSPLGARGLAWLASDRLFAYRDAPLRFRCVGGWVWLRSFICCS